jgi:hypothetical protein
MEEAMEERRRRVARGLTSACLMAVLSVRPAAAAVPTVEPPDGLAAKAFALPELYISSGNLPLPAVRAQLPNRAAWETLAASAVSADGVDAFIDARSGTATNLLESVPLIPGQGVRNRVTLADLGRRLGRQVSSVDEATVAEAAMVHVRARQAVLGIDVAQLGDAHAAPVTPELWQVTIPQRYRGVPVRHGRLVASISHGNLVTMGAETWGDVTLATVEPDLTGDAALEAGFAYAGGRGSADEILRAPALEIVPFAPPEHQTGERFAGPIGRGYGHRLVWTFEFRRAPEVERWELMVDAHTGAVLAMQDQNQYAERQIVGGVYPLTDTEVCGTPQKCGRMQIRWPMPFADTGFAAPSAFANSAGVYDYPGGLAETRLSGRFVRMADGCSTFPLGTGISESAANGAIDMGGVNGEHDCEGGISDGNTAAARSTYYEANRIAEIARGFLPSNAWVQSLLGANTNQQINFAASCNAFWNGATVNFYASGGGCRNTGEIAAVVDHEWGHGLDDNDANGILSNSSEGYADIAAIYRTQDSCVGHGFFETKDWGCGTSADGRGFNINEDQVGGSHCATDCSGVRDADFAKHADGVADTPFNHVCVRCNGGTGPCGRQTHCAAAPQRQAAWDLATRDLTGAPFNLDSQTAFLIASRLFYQGSGNIGSWYTCGCGGNATTTSDGCAAENAYMQWLTADDDNGSLQDGTPHMAALARAFARHGIGCAVPLVFNSNCGVIAQGQPALTVTSGVLQNSLSWTAPAGAQRFQVFRTDGHAGCDYGKAKIAEVTGTTFVDTEVATGRSYRYNVMAIGAQPACASKASNCATGTPLGTFGLSCTPQTVAPGNAVATCTVQSTGGFMSPVNLGCLGLANATCSFNPPTVTPFPGAPASSTLSIHLGILAQPGTDAFQVRGIAPPNVGGPTTAMTLVIGQQTPGDDLFAKFDGTLQAPSCGDVVGRSCDTRTLVAGRAELGPERNQPNTILDSCADGTEGTGSNDRVRIFTAEGVPLARGRKVTVEAFVDAREAFAEDAADFFAAADASNPVWQHIGTVTPTAAGPQVLQAFYTLPAGSRQAVRVQFRSGGTPDPCSGGTQDDRDDLVFAVAP